MIPIICGYYTKGTSYQGEARGLVKSLDALALRYDLMGIDSIGMWQQNTQVKPRIIKQFREKYRGEPIIYNDVDAFFIKRPEFFELNIGGHDIAAHMFGDRILFSGTIYLAPNERVDRLVDEWIGLCDKYPTQLPDGRDAWDQRLLQMAITQAEYGIRFLDLPPEYCYAVGESQIQYPGRDPVIFHTNAHLRCTNEC